MAMRLTRAALIPAIMAACLGIAVIAHAAEPSATITQPIEVVGSDSGSRFVQLGIGTIVSPWPPIKRAETSSTLTPSSIARNVR